MFGSLLNEAWASIIASRLRTFLAMLGIVIGVSSVVLMTSVGTGSQHAIEEAINKLGTNLLIVSPSSRQMGGLRMSDVSTLDMKDSVLIAQLASIQAAAPATKPKNFQISSGKSNWNTYIQGTTPDFFSICDWTFAQGESFTGDDIRLGNRVMVIGATIAEKLFPDQDAVGQMLRVNQLTFKIAGVLEAKGQGLDGKNQDDIIFVPFTTAQSKFSGKIDVMGAVQMIFVKVVAKEAIPQAIDDITQLLRERRKLHETQGNYFYIRDMTAVSEVASDTARALSILLGSIASISLIVGGIGIMNIMLVTVSERTREIGIRKAIGASNRHIMLQFLMEAVSIASIGSFIGLLFGIVGGELVQHYFLISAEWNWLSVVLALAVAIVVGVLSGLYPADKAAHLQPIEALRAHGA